MKKLLVAVVLGLVVMLSGCVEEKKEDYTGYKDCGSSIQCFQ